MTWAGSGDKDFVVLAGVASNKTWRGGLGALIITGISGTPSFQFAADDGVTWVNVKDLSTGAEISGVAANGMYTFLLPAGTVRMSAGGGAMNCMIIGI